MVDVDKVLKNTVKKGKVKIGTKQTKSAINDGSAKLVVISNNYPYLNEIKELTEKKNIPLYNYSSNSVDLGYTCGKAFPVSIFAVLEDGGTNILNLLKKM